jgi:glutamate-1-semialdehyde aminotransferase
VSRRYPAGTGTYSKARNQLPAIAPEYAVLGRGSHFRASNGQTYLDWTMALGAISLGYCDPEVDEAVRRQIARGTVFGLPQKIEFDFADEIGDFLPWSDYGVKYGRNGSDVTAAAIRAARHITGRDYILSSGYHGWLVAPPNKSGLAQSERDLVREFSFGADVFSMNEVQGVPANQIAAVIVEPDGPANPNPTPYLKTLRTWCDANSVMLIFDEVLTGGRMPKFTAATTYEVTPDFVTLGKAISNGYPLSVLAGRADYMDCFSGAIGYSMTYGGEATSLAAGMATLQKYRQHKVLDQLEMVGTFIRQFWTKETARLGLDLPLVGIAPRMVIKYKSNAQKTLISQEFFRRGLAVTVGFTSCFAHAPLDLKQTFAVITEVLEIVAKADEPERLVEGPVVGDVFRRQAS